MTISGWFLLLCNIFQWKSKDNSKHTEKMPFEEVKRFRTHVFQAVLVLLTTDMRLAEDLSMSGYASPENERFEPENEPP